MTWSLSGPNFFKPSVPGDLCVFRAFASLLYCFKIVYSQCRVFDSNHADLHCLLSDYKLLYYNMSVCNKCALICCCCKWQTLESDLIIWALLLNWKLSKQIAKKSGFNRCHIQVGYLSSQPKTTFNPSLAEFNSIHSCFKRFILTLIST